MSTEDWDEDDDLSEEEFDAKYAEEWEDDGDVITIEAHLEAMEKLGIDTREHDRRYFCLQRKGSSYFGDYPAIYFKRVTLNDPYRIEQLRWKTQLNSSKHWDRVMVLRQEILKLGGECFIPVDPKDLDEDLDTNDNLSEEEREEEREKRSLPRRVHVEESQDGSHHCNYDNQFWCYEEPRHEGTEMEVIAAAAALGEWEQVTKPERLKRAEDPAKLALGARYEHEMDRGQALRDKCGHLDKLLAQSIMSIGVLPQGTSLADQLVRVFLNDRIYYFKVKHGDYYQAEYNLWPRPSDLADIRPPRRFEIDDSVVGLKDEAVRSRFGEPIKKSKGEGKASIWHYPKGRIVFSHDGGYYAEVIKIEKTQPAGSCSLG